MTSVAVKAATGMAKAAPRGQMATGASTGAIALRNSAQKSVAFSNSLTETGPRVRSLHRDILRSVPWIKRAYGVAYTEGVCSPRPTLGAVSPTSRLRHLLTAALLFCFQTMRSLVTSAFKEKQGTADIVAINRLIVIGRMELEETLMIWKGPSHVRAYARHLSVTPLPPLHLIAPSAPPL